MKCFIVKQEDEEDCGAASLLSIIKYYHGYVPLEIVKNDTLTNQRGTNFYNLKVAAESYGFEAYGIKTNNLSELSFPCIVQVKVGNYYHFIVVYSLEKNSITIMDPSYGKKEEDYQDFFNQYTGYALILKPINCITCYQKSNPFNEVLKQEYFNNWKGLLLTIVLSIILVMASVISTVLIRLLFENNNQAYIFLLLIIIVFKNLIIYLKNLMVAYLNKKINISLVFNYYKHLFFLPLKYLQLKNSGDLLNRVNDLSNLKSYFSKLLVELIITCLYIVITSLILFKMNRLLFSYLLLFSLGYLIVAYFINKKIYYLFKELLASETSLMNNLTEDVMKIKTIKTLNKGLYFLTKLKSLIFNNNQKQFKLDQKNNLNEIIVNLFDDLSIIFILCYGIYYHYNFINLVIFLFLFDYFKDGIKFMINLIPNLIYFKGSYERISGLYYLQEENSSKGLKFINGDIVINDLGYQINFNSLFKNYNLKIKKGNKVLLVGNNGSGKTTLLKMLYQIIDNYEGNIMIGNQNLYDCNLEELRNHISYVSQEDVLFNDTLLNNIILDRNFDENKINNLINLLDLNTILTNKNYGLNSFIKDNLSGGEKQRIILARNLYQDFDILLLDESLSEISSNLRNKIIYNINNYFKDKTIVYVSHNKEKYHFDQIINLTARKE